jgi:hypothetical protein
VTATEAVQVQVQDFRGRVVLVTGAAVLQASRGLARSREYYARAASPGSARAVTERAAR